MLKKFFYIFLFSLFLMACSTGDHKARPKKEQQTPPAQPAQAPPAQTADPADKSKNTPDDSNNKALQKLKTIDSISLPPLNTAAQRKKNKTAEASSLTAEYLDGVLEGASGLYMSFFTDSPLEKIKIELVYSKENNSFDFRAEYKYDLPYAVSSSFNPQVCQTYSLNSFPQSLILMEETESYGFFSLSDDLWSIALSWPQGLSLSFQSQNKENIQIHIEEISFQMEEDFNLFSDNIFTVIPDSIEIKLTGISSLNLSPWVFKPKETAYEQFFPIECS